MRGVTVSTTPASRYSTVWFTPPVVMLVLVLPPGVVPGALTVLVCWPVMIGTDVDTLMTAFLFSEVSTCGLETMLTRFSEASVLSIAKNLLAREREGGEPAAGQRDESRDRRPASSEKESGAVGAIACCAEAERALP